MKVTRARKPSTVSSPQMRSRTGRYLRNFSSTTSLPFSKMSVKMTSTMMMDSCACASTNPSTWCAAWCTAAWAAWWTAEAVRCTWWYQCDFLHVPQVSGQ